jgi:hypothetical protein
MKLFLISRLFTQKAKSTDPDVMELKTALQKTAKQQNTEVSFKLLKNGDATLRVEDDTIADGIIATLSSIPNITVSGVSSPLEAYVQQRIQQSSTSK